MALRHGFEYRPEFTSAFKDLDAGERFLKQVGSVATGIMQRLRAGEFTSIDELRRAYGTGLVALDEGPPGRATPE